MEHEQRHCEHQREVDHRHRDVGQLLAARRNSRRVTGVTYRLVIEPSSFSRTMASAIRIAGNSASSSAMVDGTIA